MNRLSGFILILFLSFSIAGCSREYQSERYLYRAAKLAKNIVLAPESAPPEAFNNALRAYELVFEKYPDTLSAKNARIAVGALYMARKENAKARETFKKAMDMYPDDKNILIQARFASARSYENEGLWDNALREYRGIMRDYPDTEMGMSLPMYIAKHYEKEKDSEGAANAYIEAVAYYTDVSEKNRNTVLGYKARYFITLCYLRQENWEGAVGSFERLVMDYPGARTIPASMRMISDISVNKLNDPARAIEIFQKFLAAYPNHPVRVFIQKGLEALKNVPLASRR